MARDSFAQRVRPYFLTAVVCALTVLVPVTASHDPVSPQRTAASALNPFVEHTLPAGERRWLHGTVATRLRAGPYVYLQVREADGGEAWLVSLAATTPKQERVRALVLGQADHFHSRRLQRDFEPLLFAAVRAESP